LNDDSRRLIALSVYHCINDGSLALFASALPVMRLALGLDFLQIGTILSLGLVATMLLQLLFGFLSDRGCASQALVLGFAGIVLVDLVFPISSVFMQVLVFYVLLRSAAAVYHPVSFASIGRIYGENKTAAFGYQGAIGDVGLAVATFSTGILSEMWGWQIPFWAWGGLGMILFFYFATVIMRHQIGFYAQPVTSVAEFNNNQGNPRSLGSEFAIIAIVSSLTTVTFILFTGYMPLYFNVVEGLSPSSSTTIVAAWIGIGVFAGLMTGRIVGRCGGEAKALQMTFAIEAFLFLIANAAFSFDRLVPSGLTVGYATMVLTGIPVFITFPAVNGLLGLRMPHRRLGLTYALNLSLGLMVASVTAYLTGYLASIMSIAIILPTLLIIAVLGAVSSLAL